MTHISHFVHSLLILLNEMSPYILLGFLIAGILHVFVKPATMARHLSGKGIGPVVKAALFGIPLPLCSCGVLPTAVSLRNQGASKGATTSFLIATPQTGVDSIAATYSLLGLPFALLRPLGALVGAVAGGMSVSKADDESDSSCQGVCDTSVTEEHTSIWRKCVEAVRYGMIDMVGNVGRWLVIGLVIAALITIFMPDDLLTGLAGYPILAMLLMVIISIPMYVCATGSIPIALSLMAKGLTPGVGFVLLMAGPAANFASMMILSRSIGKKSTAIYVLSVTFTALLFGIIIDYFLPSAWFTPAVNNYTASCHSTFGVFETLCSVLLVGLLIYTSVTGRISAHHHHIELQTPDNMKQIFKIKGMACSHCSAAVTNAIAQLPGVEEAAADHVTGTLIVKGDVDVDYVRKAVAAAGFSVID